MLRFIFAALLALTIAPALAQTGTLDPIAFDAVDIIGDGIHPNGGTPPAYANLPPVFPETVDPSQWITSGGIGSNYASLAGVTQTVLESKARFRCAPVKVGQFDSIRGPGQEVFGHGHLGFGNKGWNPLSTFTTLRLNPDSSCPGAVLNGSAYWSEQVTKDDALGTGKTLIKKWDFVNLYYVSADCYGESTTGPGTDYTTPNVCQPLLRGFQSVFGFNMDNDWSAYKAQVTAYFAAHPELGTPIIARASGWHCENHDGSKMADGVTPFPTAAIPGSPDQPYLANADGTAAINCPVTDHIINQIESSECWNGKLSSPDGYGNLRPEVYYGGKKHCPRGYYRLPIIRTGFHYSHQGPDDYRKWKCSSDAMGAAALGHTARPCETTHTDYQLGWHEPTLNTWLQKCLGITIDGVAGTPAGCDYATISPTQRLLSDEMRPDGTGPVVDQYHSYSGTKPSDWFVPTQAKQGPYTGHSGMVMH